MIWYYAKGSEKIGPYSEVDFKKLIKTGIVDLNTLVWRRGMDGWQPLLKIVKNIPAASENTGKNKKTDDTDFGLAALPLCKARSTGKNETMEPLDTSRRLDAAAGFREMVLSAQWRLKEAERAAHGAATSHATARRTLDEAVFYLRELEAGRGGLLAQVSGASIYEFWFEFPGYSGAVKGATARLTQYGAIQQVSDVKGATKGGLGGAVVGGLLLGPAGAIVGAVTRRKTTIKTDVRTVDNRTFELELAVPGFCWSTVAGPEAEVTFRRFRDVVNARGTSSDDIKTLITAQAGLVRRRQGIAAPTEDALRSADKLVLREKATYDATWAEYTALRLPMLLDLRAHWGRSGLPLRLVAIALGPLMMLAWIICLLLPAISSASVPVALAIAIGFLQAAILVGAAIFYVFKVRLLKMDNTEKKKWYDNTGIVILLVICFFPMGLYGLWKSKCFAKPAKIIITFIVAGLILVAAFQDSNEKKENKQSDALNMTQIGTESIKVKDADGNVYTTIKIGNQVWMVENLRTTKYNDGTPIPLITDQNTWLASKTPGYCYYKGAIKVYGAFYNWYVVETKKLEPKGWHVPTDAEWTILENYLITNRYNWDGTKTGNKITKSIAAPSDWQISTETGTIGCDPSKNNQSGFSAFPNGFLGSNGVFGLIGTHSSWWSTTRSDALSVYSRGLSYDGDNFGRVSVSEHSGLAVRLVKDE